MALDLRNDTVNESRTTSSTTNRLPFVPNLKFVFDNLTGRSSGRLNLNSAGGAELLFTWDDDSVNISTRDLSCSSRCFRVRTTTIIMTIAPINSSPSGTVKPTTSAV